MSVHGVCTYVYLRVYTYVQYNFVNITIVEKVSMTPQQYFPSSCIQHKSNSVYRCERAGIGVKYVHTP